jgi:hypothetical protein
MVGALSAGLVAAVADGDLAAARIANEAIERLLGPTPVAATEAAACLSDGTPQTGLNWMTEGSSASKRLSARSRSAIAPRCFPIGGSDAPGIEPWGGSPHERRILNR